MAKFPLVDLSDSDNNDITIGGNQFTNRQFALMMAVNSIPPNYSPDISKTPSTEVILDRADKFDEWLGNSTEDEQ